MLPASKFRSAAVKPKPYVAVGDEMVIPPFASVGATVKAVGYYGGSHKLFTAKVIGHRNSFPKIVVRFLSDPDGNENKLALPDPITAYVHAGMLASE